MVFYFKIYNRSPLRYRIVKANLKYWSKKLIAIGIEKYITIISRYLGYTTRDEYLCIQHTYPYLLHVTTFELFGMKPMSEIHRGTLSSSQSCATFFSWNTLVCFSKSKSCNLCSLPPVAITFLFTLECLILSKSLPVSMVGWSASSNLHSFTCPDSTAVIIELQLWIKFWRVYNGYGAMCSKKSRLLTRRIAIVP